MVTSCYKSLTKIKVGAIRSRGDTSQEELMGFLHRDYHDEVNRRVPNERPQSIIFAVIRLILSMTRIQNGRLHQPKQLQGRA